MLIKINGLKCNKCNEYMPVRINLNDTGFEYNCDKCGNNNIAFISNSIHIGHRLMFEAQNIFNERKDFNLCILFSAMAIDCYLSNLYYKWREIELYNNNHIIESTEVEEIIDNELLNIRSFLQKIKAIEKLMYPSGLVAFIHSNKDIENEINNGFKDININNIFKNMQEEIIWKRNNIVHRGSKIYTEQECIRCYWYSMLFIKILDEMDQYRSEQKP